MDANKEVMDALMRGMEIEKETFDFYTEAEQKTFSAEGKRIFRWLAKTEEVHYLKLSELYNALDRGGERVFYAGATVPLEPTGVGFHTNDLEALRLAMEVERKGIAFYDELLQKSSDPEGKGMIETLRREEEEHLRVISERYDALRQ
ncbi:ferritin family protein [Geomonas sp. RF6]|uniref:ferritin family protein n=1 Tax=Geomonas sp. RF6 TaxID=2897342 RepID=UPI001E31DBE4|nr:ferritin family protein [Geomonas sp. RF6]UFS68854.1 ferritin family protein [Geomonas sp. RF6]